MEFSCKSTFSVSERSNHYIYRITHLLLDIIRDPFIKTLLHKTTNGQKLHRGAFNELRNLMDADDVMSSLCQTALKLFWWPNTLVRDFIPPNVCHPPASLHLLTLTLHPLPQEILCSHQASLCGPLRPVYLQRGGPGSARQDPKRSEPDERRPEDPSQRLGEAQLILRPAAADMWPV